MLKRLICLATTLFCSFSFIVPFCALAQGISVAPSRVFFKGNPGEATVQALTFSNTTSTPFTLMASVKDWKRDSLGRKVYSTSGTLPNSNSDWITLSMSTLTLNPGETQQVLMTLTVPDEAPQQLTNSMVFFTQTKTQQASNEKEQRLGVNVLLELGVQVYHNPSGLSAGEMEFMAFDDLGAVPTEGDTVRRLGVKIRNNGELNKDAQVRFELTHIETGEESSLNTVPIAMLPHAEQWVYAETDAHLEGRYLAIAILDAGSSYDIKVAEKEITY